jgi:hypothetical protein
MRIAPWEPYTITGNVEPDAVHVYLRSRKDVCAARLMDGDKRVDAIDILTDDGEDITLHYRLVERGRYHGRALGHDGKPVEFGLELFQTHQGMIVHWQVGDDQSSHVLAPDVGVKFAPIEELKKFSARKLLRLRDICYFSQGVAEVVFPGLPGAYIAKGEDILAALAFKPHVLNKAEARAKRQEAARTHRRVT